MELQFGITNTQNKTI